jgi:hypothetical protein
MQCLWNNIHFKCPEKWENGDNWFIMTMCLLTSLYLFNGSWPRRRCHWSFTLLTHYGLLFPDIKWNSMQRDRMMVRRVIKICIGYHERKLLTLSWSQGSVCLFPKRGIWSERDAELGHLMYDPIHIVTWGMTIDGVWIGDSIYRTLIHTTRNYK